MRGTLLSIHHADWPAYPQGENFSEALFQLTAFPPNTSFIAVDDIDQSILFIADVPCGLIKKPFDPRNFHTAIWHSDLKKLRLEEYITGVDFCTERQSVKHYWDNTASKIPGLPIPDLDRYDNNPENASFVCCIGNRIQVTQRGREVVSRSINSQSINIESAISSKVAKLYELRFFDTCIREACVQLEHEIKVEIKSKAYGDRLTDAFVQYLRKRQILESYLRTFQQELRSLFKMIRNSFMHNLANVDECSALVALMRVARVRSMIKESRAPSGESNDKTNP